MTEGFYFNSDLILKTELPIHNIEEINEYEDIIEFWKESESPEIIMEFLEVAKTFNPGNTEFVYDHLEGQKDD